MLEHEQVRTHPAAIERPLVVDKAALAARNKAQEAKDDGVLRQLLEGAVPKDEIPGGPLGAEQATETKDTPEGGDQSSAAAGEGDGKAEPAPSQADDAEIASAVEALSGWGLADDAITGLPRETLLSLGVAAAKERARLDDERQRIQAPADGKPSSKTPEPAAPKAAVLAGLTDEMLSPLAEEIGLENGTDKLRAFANAIATEVRSSIEREVTERLEREIGPSREVQAAYVQDRLEGARKRAQENGFPELADPVKSTLIRKHMRTLLATGEYEGLDTLENLWRDATGLYRARLKPTPEPTQPKARRTTATTKTEPVSRDSISGRFRPETADEHTNKALRKVLTDHNIF